MSVLKNMAVCDLRGLSAEAAGKITEIINAALVLLPKGASEELLGALQAIKKTNVASVIMVDRDVEVKTRNGFCEITAADCSPGSESILLLNGLCVINAMPEDCGARLIVNGCAIEHDSLRGHGGIQFIAVNGLRTYADFDHVKKLHGKIIIDAAYLQRLEPKTLLLDGTRLTFAKDVTPELLDEKQLTIKSNKIYCPEALLTSVAVRCIDCAPKVKRR